MGAGARVAILINALAQNSDKRAAPLKSGTALADVVDPTDSSVLGDIIPDSLVLGKSDSKAFRGKGWDESMFHNFLMNFAIFCVELSLLMFWMSYTEARRPSSSVELTSLGMQAQKGQ